MTAGQITADSIIQEIAIKAPASRIFSALTSPEELLHWWAVEGRFRATQVESDLRIGGRWQMRLVAAGQNGEFIKTVSGEYRAIDRPCLLIFTWIRDDDDHPETLVRWDLEENEGVTTVRVTHSGLTTESSRIRNGGWPVIVQLLRGYAE